MTALALLIGVLVGAVQGRITSRGGTPIADAVVRLDSIPRVARTDADGRFRIDDVPAGRWTLHVSATGHEPRAIVVRVGAATTASLDVALTPHADVVLHGTVRDAVGLRGIAFARVVALGTDAGVETAADGTFELAVPPGEATVRAYRAGYRTREWRVAAGSDRRSLDLRLEPDPLRMDPVLVPGLTVVGRSVSGAEPGAAIVDSGTLERVPVAAEMDVFRAAQTLPSVTPSSDYSAALFVRGGTPDQTRIVLDGATVHNPFHIGGFASAFNAEAISAALLQPGALPATEPSSLSGAMQLHTRMGRPDSVRVAGGLGLLSGSATLDGPLPAARGTWLLSARRNWIDLGSSIARRTGLLRRSVGYRFSDVLGRIDTQIGVNTAISATLYHNAERYRDRVSLLDGDARADWGSDAVSLRGRHQFAPDVVADAMFSTSGFRADVFHAQELQEEVFGAVPDTGTATAAVRTLAAQAGVRVQRGAHALDIGVRWEQTGSKHHVQSPADWDDVVPSLETRDGYGSTALWLHDRFESGPWRFELGARAVRPQRSTWLVLPRARIERSLASTSSIAIAGGRYAQEWWSLRDEESALSSAIAYDVVVGVPRGRAVPTGMDIVLEARTRVVGWHLGADIFHKRLYDIPVHTPYIEPFEEAPILALDAVRTGTGRVNGLEISAQGTVGRVDVALGWRLQRERRTLSGTSYTPRSDRAHRAVLNAAVPWGPRTVAVGLTWMTGQPFTPVKAVAPIAGWIEPDGTIGGDHAFQAGHLLFGEPNSARLPSYLRLDVDVRGDWDVTILGRRGRLEPYVSVLNLLNEHNPLGATHSSAGRLEVETAPQFPLLPTFGVRWRF